MKKRELVYRAFWSANEAKKAILAGQKPDTMTFMRCAEDMLKYVFYRMDQHPFGQYLENLYIEFNKEESQGCTPDAAVKILDDFTHELHRMVEHLHDLDTDIEYEVPFDEEGYYPNSNY